MSFDIESNSAIARLQSAVMNHLVSTDFLEIVTALMEKFPIRTSKTKETKKMKSICSVPVISLDCLECKTSTIDWTDIKEVCPEDACMNTCEDACQEQPKGDQHARLLRRMHRQLRPYRNPGAEELPG